MKIKKVIVDYLIITAGAFLCAAAVNIFTAPNDIAPGGLTGISTILNHLFNTPIGILIFVMNIPLFIWGYFENGRAFVTKSVIATAISSLFIDLTPNILPTYTGDKLMAAIFGGIIYGAGLALVFYRGSTTGGTDIVAKNLHNHFPDLSLGRIIILADMFVVLLALIVYHSLETALYSIITIFVISTAMDKILYGFAKDNGKVLFIVTSQEDIVVPIIKDVIKRGLTIMPAKGGFLNEDKKVIMCAVHSREAIHLSNMIKEVDPSAFVTVTTANYINGLGFQNP